MTAAFELYFVVRPRPSLADVGSPHAWFAAPSTCSVASVSRELSPLELAELKLSFLARIHHDTVEAVTNEWEAQRRDDARALLDAVTLDLATFDRLWTIEPVGVPIELATRQLSTESLRAVLPRDEVMVEGPTAMQSLRARWSQHLVRRPVEEACALVALRAVVARLLEAFPQELASPRVAVHGLAGVPSKARLDAALAADGWVSGRDATLWIALREVRVLDDVRAEVVSAFRVLTFMPRRRTLVHGEVITELRSIEGAWTVAEMTLEATTRRSIGARGAIA